MDKKWYVCDDCGKNLSSYKTLWRHKKTCKSKDGLRDEILFPQYGKSGAKRATNSEPLS